MFSQLTRNRGRTGIIVNPARSLSRNPDATHQIRVAATGMQRTETRISVAWMEEFHLVDGASREVASSQLTVFAASAIYPAARPFLFFIQL